jgi:hypothetical protein
MKTLHGNLTQKLTLSAQKPTLSAQKPATPPPYDRLSQLPRLIGLWPSEMQDFSAAGTLKILALLRKALRSERSRGRSGHWAYDLNRHLALAASLKAERAHLRALNGAPVAPRCATGNGQAPQAGKILHLPAAAAKSKHLAASKISRSLPCADQPVFLLPILVESSS